MRHLPRAAAAAGLAAATLLVMAPIARHGTPIGHDSDRHIVWAAQFADSLSAGVLYPRWLPDVNAGLGNPTFVFYGPLLYYVAALFRPLAGGAPRALDLAAAAFLLASGVAAYRYLRGGLDRGAALLGAVAVMALPYRLLDLYERAALAEFAAFVWPPLALLVLPRLALGRTARDAGLAAAALAATTAGLGLTHLPSLVLWGPAIALAAVAQGGPAGRAATAARAWAALALGLGLAALYLIPAYAERRFVQLEWLDWVARAEDHTLFSTRIAPDRAAMAAFNRKVSVLACWEGALAALAAAAALWPGSGRPWEGRSAAGSAFRPRLPVAGAAALAAAAFALMTPWSAPLWPTLPVLSAIQFPWRLLLVLTPAAALLVACAAARTVAAGAPPAARVLGAAALILLGANLAVAVRDIVLPARLDPREAARLAADPAGAQDVAEYRPRGAPAAGFPRLPRAISLVPGGRVEVLLWGPTRRVVAVDAPLAGRLRLRTFLYPGWQGSVDGTAATLLAGPDGVIEANVPAGRHVVEVRFGPTAARRAGLAASIASALALSAWILAGRRARGGAGG